MKQRFRGSEIPLISAPITSNNRRNLSNRPVTDLGRCTPFQLLNLTGISSVGTVCIIGSPSRGIGIAKGAFIRQSQKPFLFLGTTADKQSAFTALTPDWSLNAAQERLPSGNGALYFEKPYAAYMDICESIEEWGQNYFIIIHLGNGLQIGAELMNVLCALEQCLIFCDSVPQSIRNSDSRAISPLEFMKQMHYLLLFSSGSETKELIELLPTYQYEKVSNTTSFNMYKGRSMLHPFRGHRGHGLSMGQTRTLEFKKDVFEMDELQQIFSNGYMLIYNARTNRVYLAQPA